MSETTSNLDSVMDKARGAVPPPPRPAAAPKPAVKAVEAPAPAPVAEKAPEAAPAVPEVAAETAVVETPKVDAPKALEVSVADTSILSGAGTLALHEALQAALGADKNPSFKIAALQSGYTAELGALAFEDISRIQASAVDAHAARMKLLRTLHSRIQQFSCGNIKFQDWLKVTAQGDYDTLMYGLYASTYPGENDFDVNCRHCGHQNKLTVDVGQLARVESDDVYAEIRKLLDPKTDFKGAIQNSLVGRTVQRKLPQSGIIAEIRNPSIQDYLDGVQWFVNMQDKNTGMLPSEIAGAEVIRTLTMYVQRLLVPVKGGAQYLPVENQLERSQLIGRLPRADGQALTDAVDAETKKLEVSYSLPAYNCAGCGKRNEDLFLDFEALLFIKLREKA
jgi:DNA-directed RNA polymerase subunit RPC12/RpoP